MWNLFNAFNVLNYSCYVKFTLVMPTKRNGMYQVSVTYGHSELECKPLNQRRKYQAWRGKLLACTNKTLMQQCMVHVMKRVEIYGSWGILDSLITTAGRIHLTEN